MTCYVCQVVPNANAEAISFKQVLTIVVAKHLKWNSVDLNKGNC